MRCGRGHRVKQGSSCQEQQLQLRPAMRLAIVILTSLLSSMSQSPLAHDGAHRGQPVPNTSSLYAPESRPQVSQYPLPFICLFNTWLAVQRSISRKTGASCSLLPCIRPIRWQRCDHETELTELPNVSTMHRQAPPHAEGICFQCCRGTLLTPGMYGAPECVLIHQAQRFASMSFLNSS